MPEYDRLRERKKAARPPGSTDTSGSSEPVEQN
jgi:hypothetical protein